MSVLHDAMHFVRWRLVPIRYAGKVRGGLFWDFLRRRPPRTTIAIRVRDHGYDSGPTVPQPQIDQIDNVYRPRIRSVKEQIGGHPFENLFCADDIEPDNPVFQLAFSPNVLGVADDYFAGRFLLDSIQVLYSWPTDGQLCESQLWHKDYGDSKSFHWIAYVSNVTGPDDGPFQFVDKTDAQRIMRAPFIRRISDKSFSKELGDGRLRQFYGSPGESIFIDPAICYHCGSRCKNARLAIFVTFSTSRPFVAPGALIGENRERILHAAQTIRPDLSDPYLKRLLRL